MSPVTPLHSWQPQLTQDGSFTFFSERFGESFHSSLGARSEAFSKYVEMTRLREKAQNFTTDPAPSLAILDVCYGLGYNTAAALETIWQVNPRCRVTLYGLELDDSVPQAAVATHDLQALFLQAWSPRVQSILTALAQSQVFQDEYLTAQLYIGDARTTIQHLQAQQFQAEAIFLDPFSPQRCPQLWTVEFLQAVASCLAPTGILSTYSRAASVRTALNLAGLDIGSIPAPANALAHEWSQGTVAAWEDHPLIPLTQLEQEHLQTRAAVPFRDPTLQDDAATILQRHTEEQLRSQFESTSSWRRRWGIR